LATFGEAAMTSTMSKHTVLAGLLILLTGSVSWGATVFDEGSTDSGSNAAPTQVTLNTFGTSSIKGSLHVSDTADTQDWFAVTVPAGFQIVGLSVPAASYTGDSQSFLGIHSGGTFPDTPTSLTTQINTPGNYIGYVHFGTSASNGILVGNNLGTDLLPVANSPANGGQAAGSTGFTDPLGPGTYTFMVQQTSPVSTTYQLDFSVVPEPSTLCLTVLGGIALLAPAVRKSRRKKLSATLRST
jgi:hypothetical protein